jgi:hypothetical protein
MRVIVVVVVVAAAAAIPTTANAYNVPQIPAKLSVGWTAMKPASIQRSIL